MYAVVLESAWWDMLRPVSWTGHGAVCHDVGLLLALFPVLCWPALVGTNLVGPHNICFCVLVQLLVANFFLDTCVPGDATGPFRNSSCASSSGTSMVWSGGGTCRSCIAYTSCTSCLQSQNTLSNGGGPCGFCGATRYGTSMTEL